jgi:hypothetical protein
LAFKLNMYTFSDIIVVFSIQSSWFWRLRVGATWGTGGQPGSITNLVIDPPGGPSPDEAGHDEGLEEPPTDGVEGEHREGWSIDDHGEAEAESEKCTSGDGAARGRGYHRRDQECGHQFLVWSGMG